MSSSGTARAPGRLAAINSSRLVRKEVRGVRSSWPASATRRACRSRDSSRARSIALKLAVSLANSSLPVTGMGVRSLVRATRSTARLSRATGRSPARATVVPAKAASATPPQPTTNSTQARRLSTRSVWIRLCASTRVLPSSSLRVRTRWFRVVRRLCCVEPGTDGDRTMPRSTSSKGTWPIRYVSPPGVTSAIEMLVENTVPATSCSGCVRSTPARASAAIPSARLSSCWSTSLYIAR